MDGHVRCMVGIAVWGRMYGNREFRGEPGSLLMYIIPLAPSLYSGETSVMHFCFFPVVDTSDFICIKMHLVFKGQMIIFCCTVATIAKKLFASFILLNNFHEKGNLKKLPASMAVSVTKTRARKNTTFEDKK